MFNKAFFCGLLATAALGAAPVIRDLVPHGMQRGKVFELRMKGSDLTAGAKVETTIPGVVSRMVPSQSGQIGANSELVYLVELKKDADPGLYPIRVSTPNGLSNVMLFSVGIFPEVEEKETADIKTSNGTIETAESVPVPVVVNGKLTAADVDTYSFNAKAGERLVFEVEARRAGSAIDPHLDILDTTGKVIAKNDDAEGLGVDSRLQVTFAKAGSYRVRVRDSRYSDQAQNFYRLKIGAYMYFDGVFPLGGKRGETTEFTFVGGNLPSPVKITKKLDGPGRTMQVGLPGSAALPVPVIVGDLPEALEPGELSLGSIVNGRISKPGEIDKYKLKVEPGQQWFLELSASSMGTSSLDGILTVYDENNKKLFSRDDLAGADPALAFTVPEKIHEVTVAVEDVQGRGGPTYGYRLQTRQHPPDFTAELLTPFVNVPAGGTAAVSVQVQRRGFDGPILLKIPDLPEGFVVDGGHVPSEAAAQSPFTEGAGFRSARSLLTITAPANAELREMKVKVIAEAITPAGKIERVALAPGMVTPVRGTAQKPYTAPWLGMEMAMAVTRPLPVSLEVPLRAVRLSQGFGYPLFYSVKKAPGAKLAGSVQNRMLGAVGNLRILQGPPAKTADGGSILIMTNFATPATKLDMVFETQVEMNGEMVSIPSPAVEVEVVPGFEIQLEHAAVEMRPDGRAELSGRIRREPTFEGNMVRLQAEDLPEKVKCSQVQTVAEDMRFSMVCDAAGAAPGTYDIRLVASAPNVGNAKEDYKPGDWPAKLTVLKAK